MNYKRTYKEKFKPPIKVGYEKYNNVFLRAKKIK